MVLLDEYRSCIVEPNPGGYDRNMGAGRIEGRFQPVG